MMEGGGSDGEGWWGEVVESDGGGMEGRGLVGTDEGGREGYGLVGCCWYWASQCIVSSSVMVMVVWCLHCHPLWSWLGGVCVIVCHGHVMLWSVGGSG